MSGILAALTALGRGVAAITAGPGGSYSDLGEGGPASVTLAFAASGNSIDVTKLNDGPINLGTWMSPVGGEPSSNFDVMVTLTSGTLSSGSGSGSWLSLGSSRSWTVSRSSLGSKTCTFSLAVRRNSSGEVLDTKSYTLTATQDV